MTPHRAKRPRIRAAHQVQALLEERHGEEVDVGEVYKPDEPWKKFTNRDDNYVVDPEETTSFRAVWREWHPEETNV